MSLFQCENCGCCENTALSMQGFDMFVEDYDWTGIEDRRGLKLCSACGPSQFSDGTPCEGGEWHGEFERTYLPMGMFRTASNGNLEHIETGDQDFRKYALDQPDTKRVAPRKPSMVSMALLAGVAGVAMAGPEIAGPYPLDPSPRRLPPSRHGSKTLDQMDASVRDEESRKAKAEAKRQRRLERNRRLAAKEQ